MIKFKKIGLLTCLYSLVFWLVLELFAYMFGMMLRPKYYTILLIMFLIGLFIYITAFVSIKIKEKKTVLTVVWTVGLELCLAILAIFALTFNFTISPVEKIADNHLILDYGVDTKSYQEYNLFFYKVNR